LVESKNITKKNKLQVFTTIYQNVCRTETIHPEGPDRICIGMPHAFAAILVLGSNRRLYTSAECIAVNDMLIGILKYLKMRLVSFEKKIMMDDDIPNDKQKYKKIKKIRFRNIIEQILPYAFGVISKFYPMNDLQTDDQYYTTKVSMVQNILLALSCREVNGSGGVTPSNAVSSKRYSVSSNSCSSNRFYTNSLNFDLLHFISLALRTTHFIADDTCGDTLLLVAEISYKMLKQQQGKNIEKQLKLEIGKTKEELLLIKQSKLPGSVYFDPQWFVPWDIDSSHRLKLKRFLPKDWYLGYGNANHSSINRRSSSNSSSRRSKGSSSSRNSLSPKRIRSSVGSSGLKTPQLSSSKKKKYHKREKVLPIERPTRFSTRGGRGKETPNYKEHDSEEDDIIMEKDDEAIGEQRKEEGRNKKNKIADEDHFSEAGEEEKEETNSKKAVSSALKKKKRKQRKHQQEDEDDDYMSDISDSGNSNNYKSEATMSLSSSSSSKESKKKRNSSSSEKENSKNFSFKKSKR
jgi:hypothetical protein